MKIIILILLKNIVKRTKEFILPKKYPSIQVYFTSSVDTMIVKNNFSSVIS